MPHDPLKNLRRRASRPGHEEIEPRVAAQMRGVGRAIEAALEGTGYGYTLLVWPIGDADGRMNYISNGAREDMIAALKELVANFEGRIAHETPAGLQ